METDDREAYDDEATPIDQDFPKNVALGILSLLALRDRPTRTKTIISRLKLEDYSESMIYKTLDVLEKQKLVLKVSNRKRLVDYIASESGRQYLSKNYRNASYGIAKELADRMTEIAVSELPPEKQTRETRARVYGNVKDLIEETLRTPLPTSSQSVIMMPTPDSKRGAKENGAP